MTLILLFPTNILPWGGELSLSRDNRFWVLTIACAFLKLISVAIHFHTTQHPLFDCIPFLFQYWPFFWMGCQENGNLSGFSEFTIEGKCSFVIVILYQFVYLISNILTGISTNLNIESMTKNFSSNSPIWLLSLH